MARNRNAIFLGHRKAPKFHCFDRGSSKRRVCCMHDLYLGRYSRRIDYKFRQRHPVNARFAKRDRINGPLHKKRLRRDVGISHVHVAT